MKKAMDEKKKAMAVNKKASADLTKARTEAVSKVSERGAVLAAKYDAKYAKKAK